MLSLNSQMPKSSKTRKMSNFQMLSNSADFKKRSSVDCSLHRTPHPTQSSRQVKTTLSQDVNFLKLYDFSRNDPLLKIPRYLSFMQR